MRCSAGKSYAQVIHFSDHQRVSHPTPSKIAALSITWDDSGNPPEPLRNPPESFRPEWKGTGNGTGKGTGNREGDSGAIREFVPRETADTPDAIEVCDECEASIPEPPGWVGLSGIENKHHLESCSLYDSEKE